jgi:putative membrane protein
MGNESTPEKKLPPLPERETLRLHQANERTLLAWMRTALAMMALGFILARFGLFLRQVAGLDPSHPPFPHSAPASLWLGVTLSGLGALTILAALVRHREIEQAIERHEVGKPAGAMIYVVGGLVATLGIAIAALLIATR